MPNSAVMPERRLRLRQAPPAHRATAKAAAPCATLAAIMPGPTKASHPKWLRLAMPSATKM